MRIRLQYIFIFMLLMVAIASSCSSEEDAPQQESLVPDYEHPISMAIDKQESRAVHELNDANLKTDFFGVYAYFTGESAYQFLPANSFLYLDNTKFKPQAEDDKVIWHGDPNVYYPLGETNLTFVAYAPLDVGYEDNNKQIIKQLKSVDFKANAIDITYAPAQNVEKQIDFCVADPIFNQTPTSNSLPIAFNHMLTHVTFYAKVTVAKENIGIKVDKLTLKHILGENVLRWSPTDTSPAYKWVGATEAPESKYVNYEMTHTSNYTHLHGSNIANDPQGYVRLQNESGFLYLLPQTLKNAIVEVEFSLHEVTNGLLKDETFMDLVTEIAIPTDVVWQPGRKIRYNMDINIANITQVSIAGIDDGQVGTVEWEDVNPSDNSFTVK